MAPGKKGIQIQKELSKGSLTLQTGQRVQPSGCWGTWPADLQGRGGASCGHAGFRTGSGWRYSKKLRARL